jgi:hypothetical protein
VDCVRGGGTGVTGQGLSRSEGACEGDVGDEFSGDFDGESLEQSGWHSSGGAGAESSGDPRAEAGGKSNGTDGCERGAWGTSGSISPSMIR